MGTLKAGPPDVASIAELAQIPGVRECLQWVVREKQWINEQHLQVCRIPAPTFLEGKRADWMITQFRSLGYDAQMTGPATWSPNSSPTAAVPSRPDGSPGYGACAADTRGHRGAAGWSLARTRSIGQRRGSCARCWPLHGHKIEPARGRHRIRSCLSPMSAKKAKAI